MQQQQTIFEFGRLQYAHDWLIAGVCLALLLGLAAFIYRRDARELWRPYAWILLILRCCVLVVITVVFLDPRLRTETTVQQQSKVLVLTDNSASMTIEDVPAGEEGNSALQSRLSASTNLLTKTPLLAELRKVHEVEIYSFGSHLRSLAVFNKEDGNNVRGAVDSGWARLLHADQQQTRLGEALAEALRANENRPLAGIVILTDGNHNAGLPVEPSLTSAKQRSVPIAAVGLGREQPAPNLRVADLQSPSRAFRGDEMPVTAYLQSNGFDKRNVAVELLLANANGNEPPVVVEQTQVAVDGETGPLPINFRYTPKETGTWRLSVRIPGQPEELMLSDNEMSATFDVIDQKTRVLLFAGGPTRDYRFVRTMLYRDDSVETSVYLQSSPEPVAQDADHVLIAFPKRREELFEYDLIIGFDANWSELDPDTRELVIEWVSKQAGGIIFVAGPVDTPALTRNSGLSGFLQLFPVVFREVIFSDTGSDRDGGPWPIRFTTEGQNADFLALDDDRQKSQRQWEQFQGLYATFPVQSVRPGATVLAESTSPRSALGSQAAPIFASQFFGAGRVLYVGTNELWRLRSLGDEFYDRLWIQSVRHFAQGRLLRGTSRANLFLDADRYTLGSLLPIRARILDAEFNPTTAETVSVAIVDPAGNSADLTLQAEASTEGQFRGEFVPHMPGEYRIQLLVPDTEELVERRIVVTLPDLEFATLNQDRATLKHLADATGGRYYTLPEADQIPKNFEDRSETAVLSGTPIPLWDRWYVLLFCVLLLSAEWLIRKLLFLA